MFAKISPEMAALIERAATDVALRAGETLFTQGEAAETFFVLQSGEVEISVLSAGGRKLALEIMTPGEIFGEIGLFAGRRTASATALTDVRLRRVRRADLLAALRSEPDLALQVIELLCERLRMISDKLEERAFLPLPARLASRILHLDAKVVSRTGRIAVSQADLADFVGATREAVAKTLTGWRARGLVALSRGGVQVLDAAALRALAENVED